jgi:hypothetical protein
MKNDKINQTWQKQKVEIPVYPKITAPSSAFFEKQS